MATSPDGLSWERVAGPLEGGACLDPSSDAEAFDCVHVGVGDVTVLPNGTHLMYYFGGGLDDEVLPGRPGMRMQIGLAASSDGGVSWERCCGGKPVLQRGGPDSFDELFVSWPRVLPPWETEKVPGIPSGKWYMSYHTSKITGPPPQGLRWAAGAAFSDDGVTWEKAPGPVLEGGPQGAWDSQGIGVRHVRARDDGKLVMFYEAVDAAGDHAIGLAESSDGVEWRRCAVPGAAAPGGPFVAKGAKGDWDDKVVGTPYSVPPQQPDGSWRLYFVGQGLESEVGLEIGLAESSGSDILGPWLKFDKKSGLSVGRTSVPASGGGGLYGRVLKDGAISQEGAAAPEVSGALGDLDLGD